MNGQENSKEDTDENYVINLYDKLLGITSSRQQKYDFHLDGFYDDFKVAVTYCEKYK